jgi:CheY-like chemotaxis protein
VPGIGRPVLVADDDPIAVQLILASLDRLRLCNPRIVVGDGDEAVAELSHCLVDESARTDPPALVLLDGRMPGRSGLEVMTWMREQPALADVPVVVLTADSDVESIQGAYANGATAYLVKPVGYEALGDVLRGLDLHWMLL